MVAQLKEVPKIVSQEEIQRRTVKQIVGLFVATVAKTVGEARPLGIAQYSTTTESEVEGSSGHDQRRRYNSGNNCW